MYSKTQQETTDPAYQGHTNLATYFSTSKRQLGDTETCAHTERLSKRVFGQPPPGIAETVCSRSLITNPWRPATFYREGFNSPMDGLRPRVTCLTAGRNCLTELEGLKVPPVFSAARNALYTRYTPNDWLSASIGVYHMSDRSRQHAERIRFDNVRMGKETDDKTQRTQEDVGKKLGERVSDVAFWKKELDWEIEKILTEIKELAKARAVAEKLRAECENQLHIAEECIYNREKRRGLDLVHDQVEKDLLGEIDTIRECQDKLLRMIEKAKYQQRRNVEALRAMEKNSKDKFTALKIDELCHSLNDGSAGLDFYPGVETVDKCQSVPETWAKFSDDIIRHAQGEREASAKLRTDIEDCVNQCCDDLWRQWNKVNTSLTQRIQETTDVRNREQAHLNKVLQEISDLEKSIEYLKKCILDKEAPMKVSQTRLRARLERPGMEQCRDPAQHRLVEEVYEIRETVEQLQQRLAEAENALQVLLKSKAALEHDLAVKANSLFIDREMCLGLRKFFPIAPRLYI